MVRRTVGCRWWDPIGRHIITRVLVCLYLAVLAVVEVGTAEPGEMLLAGPPKHAWTFLGAGAAVLSVIAYLGLRARGKTARQLERQRARIAMDLHDEMGSGLGSIGILSGLAASDEVDDAHRRRLVGQIAEIAEEMGSSLTDIVWSLRTSRGTLEDLAVYLAERGDRMFPEDSRMFRVQFPETWPVVRLGLDTRRNLQLIAIEALHNAARHSGASHVTLSIGVCPRGWALNVIDDGSGFDPDRSRNGGHGLGLRSMVRRAAMIGAEVTWESGAGRGTVVTICFDGVPEHG